MKARTGKILFFLAIPALAAQAEAGAPGASTGITLTGDAPAVCVLAGASTAFIAVDEPKDPGTALVKGASDQLRIANAMCNFTTQISLNSYNGGLASDRATVVPYTVILNWNGVSVTLDTSRAKAVQQQTSGAIRGALTLNFNTQKSTTPIAKGAYRDTVTVTIGGVM